MNQKWLVLGIVPLFLSGCFSAGERFSEINNGENGPARGKAATLDVVTFPVQAPVLLPAFTALEIVKAAGDRKAKIEYQKLMLILENNPSIALEERWDRNSIQHLNVFIASFSNPKVKYTNELLEKIHQTCLPVQDYVFRSELCSKDFLLKHFDEEYAKSIKWSLPTFALKLIIENPNTPIELLEKVASSHDFNRRNSGDFVQQAQMILRKRQSEQSAEPIPPSVLP